VTALPPPVEAPPPVALPPAALPPALPPLEPSLPPVLPPPLVLSPPVLPPPEPSPPVELPPVSLGELPPVDATLPPSLTLPPVLGLPPVVDALGTHTPAWHSLPDSHSVLLMHLPLPSLFVVRTQALTRTALALKPTRKNLRPKSLEHTLIIREET
jgi:hypothetical protein